MSEKKGTSFVGGWGNSGLESEQDSDKFSDEEGPDFGKYEDCPVATGGWNSTDD